MRTKVNSRALSLSAGSANSFICLIEIQAKNVFFRVFASAIGEIFVFSDDLKPHFCSTLINRCCPLLPWRKSARGLGLGFVANHFDVVPVRTNDESCIVSRVVVRA